MLFIDLKKNTKVFFRDDHQQPDSIDQLFFSRQVLKLERSFEEKLFEHSYESKKVIFIIDGFDEISPKYKKFVTRILETIGKSDNHMLVTTRPHCAEELEKELETKATRILPFNGDEQILFLTK